MNNKGGPDSAALTAAKAWRAEYPFASHWLPLSEGRLHYIDEGPRPAEELPPGAADRQSADGPTLLFVHGNPTWSFHWRRLIAGLSAEHRCIAVDHLGCGLSDKPPRPFRLADRIDHLLRLIDTLGLRRVTLVAQDWGGAIGLGAMLDRLDQLERVVLFNTGAFPPWFVPRRIAVCRTPVLGRLGLQGLNLFSRAAVRMTLARSAPLSRPVAEAYLAPYNTWANRRAVYEFVADIPRSARHPTWSVLQRIEAGLASIRPRPVKLIWGMRDWCFTPACLDRFLQHWPDAEVTRLAEVGHWVVEDAPEESLRLMKEFLASTAATPAPATIGA
ncbi:alpha/beta fold hydrolase [Botrimarina hoheduenensis]|uniref:Haloalkane dehalogenase n=1 Tax=Botrimarina hoheduenensis TaxID=2528000 RepID=A0A5C5W957_9BACT|nr:alpha/beta fold hydrolase [Botrimarina hoheduenensis]TWT47416.1 Haloalkane dehalogenase [Botrimarina hoheduenensis]